MVNDSCGTLLTSCLTLSVRKGMKLYIAVGGKHGAQGSLNLMLTQQAPQAPRN